MAKVSNYTALLSGTSLVGTAIKTPVVVTYSFDSKAQSHLADVGFSDAAIKSWTAFTALDQQYALQAMQMMSQVSGIEFVRVGAGKGDIRFGKVDFALTDAPGAAGFAYYPIRTISKTETYDGDIGSDVFISKKEVPALHLMLHEIGHAVGLKHPFDGDTTLVTNLDNTGNTVMSYTGNWQSKLGYLDVSALQQLYGTSGRPSGTLASYGYDDGVVTQVWGSASSTIAGTSANDHIIAGAGADTVAGFNGNDRLDGGSGNDTLFGGLGNDTFSPGSGNDMVFGGSFDWGWDQGIDTVDYTSSTSAITVSLEKYWDGSAWVFGKATGSEIGTDKLDSIENVRGGKGADAITGDAYRNVLYGNAGEDTIKGGGGNDSLYGDSQMDSLFGDAGEDKLFGGGNHDVLFGGEERDWLDGGTANDQLTGNGGRDYFIFRDGYDRDRVMDFENNIDTIKLSDDLWSGTKSVATVISQYCEIEGGNAVFDFGGGDILTIAGVTSLNSLSNDILIF